MILLFTDYQNIIHNLRNAFEKETGVTADDNHIYTWVTIESKESGGVFGKFINYNNIANEKTDDIINNSFVEGIYFPSEDEKLAFILKWS